MFAHSSTDRMTQKLVNSDSVQYLFFGGGGFPTDYRSSFEIYRYTLLVCSGLSVLSFFFFFVVVVFFYDISRNDKKTN